MNPDRLAQLEEERTFLLGSIRDLLTLALERAWTKAQILEAWLNLTPFRGELEGVDAAARSLIGKRAAGLDRIAPLTVDALGLATSADVDVVVELMGGIDPARACVE